MFKKENKTKKDELFYCTQKKKSELSGYFHINNGAPSLEFLFIPKLLGNSNGKKRYILNQF